MASILFFAFLTVIVGKINDNIVALGVRDGVLLRCELAQDFVLHFKHFCLNDNIRNYEHVVTRAHGVEVLEEARAGHGIEEHLYELVWRNVLRDHQGLHLSRIQELAVLGAEGGDIEAGFFERLAHGGGIEYLGRRDLDGFGVSGFGEDLTFGDSAIFC